MGLPVFLDLDAGVNIWLYAFFSFFFFFPQSFMTLSFPSTIYFFSLLYDFICCTFSAVSMNLSVCLGVVCVVFISMCVLMHVFVCVCLCVCMHLGLAVSVLGSG